MGVVVWLTAGGPPRFPPPEFGVAVWFIPPVVLVGWLAPAPEVGPREPPPGADALCGVVAAGPPV